MSDLVRTALVVDDHAVLAELVSRAVAEAFAPVEVTVCGDIAAATDEVESSRPDTVILDAQLPSGDGISLIPTILGANPDARIVVLTGHPTHHGQRTALDRGAIGYLGKANALSHLIEALRHANVGNPATDPGLAGSPSDPGIAALTPREKEVLGLLAEGRHVQDIAVDLDLSIHTARGYVKSTLAKLDARSQLEAVAKAVREGIVRIG